MLYKGFGFDEIAHGIIDALRLSLQRGRFSFVTYTITILLVLMGIVNGFLTILQYYSTDYGVVYFLMLFIYGAIWWLIAGGLVMSIGIIIDVYTNEREGLGKVIVFPFFITAIGLILYCASLFTLPVKEIPHFSLYAGRSGCTDCLLCHCRYHLGDLRSHYPVLHQPETGGTPQTGDY